MGMPKFEQNWREAFDGAESDVSDSVWSRVEFELVIAESKGNRSKLVFYRRLAATVALFAVALASYITYDSMTDEVSGELTLQKSSQSTSGEATAETTDRDQNKSEDQSAQLGNIQNPGVGGATNALMTTRSTTSTLAASKLSTILESDEGNFEESQGRVHLVFTMPTIPSPDVKIKSKAFYQPVFPRQLPKMPSYFMASTKKENNSERLWASIGMGGGSYDPGSVQTSGPVATLVADPMNLSSRQPQSSQESIGSAYSVGAQIGTMLTGRLVLQTGLAYMVQRIDYTSNYSNLAPNNKMSASVAEYAATAQTVTYVAPYEVRSSNEYISVPLQLGYRIIDKRIGLQLNTGVATDVFVRNTLKDKSGQSEKFTQAAGEDSPYRDINFTGLAGVELSHKIGTNSRLALTPGLRYTFNSILKDEATLAYNPLVLEVGIKFKYIFN